MKIGIGVSSICYRSYYNLFKIGKWDFEEIKNSNTTLIIPQPTLSEQLP